MHVRPRRPVAPKSHPERHADVTPDLVIVNVANIVQHSVEQHAVLVMNKDPAAVHEGPLFTGSSSGGGGCRRVFLALAPLAKPGSPAVAVGAVVHAFAVAPAPVQEQAAPVVVACIGKQTFPYPGETWQPACSMPGPAITALMWQVQFRRQIFMH